MTQHKDKFFTSFHGIPKEKWDAIFGNKTKSVAIPGPLTMSVAGDVLTDAWTRECTSPKSS